VTRATGHEAVRIGLSSKSDWRLATHWTMAQQWFEDGGLMNVRQSYVNVHYPKEQK